MLENLFPKWGGKAFVLVLLGFASTDFIITMTLLLPTQLPTSFTILRSALAVQPAAGHTSIARSTRCDIPQRGFKEAIGVAVVLVTVYLILNSVVTIVGLNVLLHHPKRSTTGSGQSKANNLAL